MPESTASNDRRLNQQIRSLQALNAVAMAVGSSLDLDQVMREAVHQVLAVVGADCCAIYLREPRSGDLVLRAIKGVSPALAQHPDLKRVVAGTGWWGEMASSMAPFILHDIDSENVPARELMRQEGLQSAAYVPLQTSDHVNGAIVIGTRSSHSFDADDLRLLLDVGKQVGVAVEKAHLFDTEQTRARQLGLINEVGRQIAAMLRVRDVAERVVTALCDDFGYQFAAVLLLDSTGQELEMEAIAGSPSQSVRPGEFRLPVTRGIMGRCVRTGKVMLVNDVTRDPDYLQPPGAERWGSELCAPIKVGDRILGVLNVESELTNAFDENDVVVIQTLASQLGIALQNAQLFREQQEQLTKLQTLDQIIQAISSSLDLDEALDRILVELVRVVKYDSAAVWLIKGGSLRALAARHRGGIAPDTEVTLPAGDPLFQEVWTTGRPLVLADARADPRFTAVGGTDYVRGWVCAPLIVKNRVIGCLTVDSRKVAAYDEEDAQVIMTFARHAAIALENAQLYEQTKQQVEALEALHRISVDLQSRRTIEDLLENIVRWASDLVGAAGGGLFLYDPDAELLTLTISLGVAEEYLGHTLRPGEGLAGRVVQTGKPMWVDDYASWEGRPHQHSGIPFRAAICVPLEYEERILGVLSLAEQEPGRTFSEVDAQLLTLLAAEAGVALENARLYEELERLAIRDGLTGLYNHRHFHELLNQEVGRAERYGHPVTLLVMDLDGFKEYNDRHGHVAGDEALRGIANLLRESCRQGDLIARYGGEEFVIILPETSVEEATHVAERIRQTIEHSTQRSPFLSSLTASIGVAGYPDDASTASDLLIAADGMMYQAKARGKNRVVSSRG